MDPYIMPRDRKCFCGKNDDPDPASSEHVRTVNTWTIAFCNESCARAFDSEIAWRIQPTLQIVSS